MTMTMTQTVTWMCVAMLALGLLQPTQGRYLPTRSQDDRLDKLRELLRDLLESEIQRAGSSECGGPQTVQLMPADRNSNQLIRDLGFVERKRYFKRDTAATSDVHPN